MKKLFRKIYRIFHDVVDQVMTLLAGIILSSVIFIFAALTHDIHRPLKMLKSLFMAGLGAVSSLFRRRKTPQQEQQEAMQRQIDLVLASLHSMVARPVIPSAPVTPALSGAPVRTGAIMSDAITFSGIFPSPEHVNNDPDGTHHVSARNQLRASRAINGDITIIYSDLGITEMPTKDLDRQKPITPEALDGWWEE